MAGLLGKYWAALLVFSMLGVGLMSLANDFRLASNEIYNDSGDTFFSGDNSSRKSFSMLNNSLSSSLSNVRESIDNSSGIVTNQTGDTTQVGISDDANFGFWDILFKGTWGILKNIGNSLTFMITIISTVIGNNSIFQLPSWFINGISSLIGFIIFFAILTIVFKREP